MGIKNLVSLLNTIIESKNINKRKYSIESFESTDDIIYDTNNSKVNDSTDIMTIKTNNSDTKSDFLTQHSYVVSVPKIFSDFSNQRIAIDASLLIYQYVIGIRNTSSDLISSEGDFTSHIHAVVSKSLLYLDNNITPIFVFDGKPPDMKSDVLIKRRSERMLAKKQYEDELDEGEKIKLFKKSTIITYKQMDQCKEILRAMGIPVVESKEEADSQLAYLTKAHNVYGAGSEDMDLLAFGATKLLKNISSSKKNNIIEYDLNDTLKNLNLNMLEFIDLCILLGCDYVDVIGGVTPKIAYEIITKHRTIINFLVSPDSKDPRFNIPDNYRKQYIVAKDYFIKCPHNKVEDKDLKIGVYNIDKIKSLLINKYSYSRTKVEKIISKLRNEPIQKKSIDYVFNTFAKSDKLSLDSGIFINI